jgi:hypothetical protein
MTSPSVDAESSVLKLFEIAKTVTGFLWPKRQAFGCGSTSLLEECTVHTDTVQSTPAVTRVRESANSPQESCP